MAKDPKKQEAENAEVQSRLEQRDQAVAAGKPQEGPQPGEQVVQDETPSARSPAQGGRLTHDLPANLAAGQGGLEVDGATEAPPAVFNRPFGSEPQNWDTERGEPIVDMGAEPLENPHGDDQFPDVDGGVSATNRRIRNEQRRGPDRLGSRVG